MNGSSIFRAFAIVLLVAVVVGGGFAAYNAGYQVGFQHAAAAAVAAGDVVPVTAYPYGPGPYGWGGGIGFFGILFWIIAFFIVVGLLRAAFGWGRWGGRDRWGGGPAGFGGPGGGRRRMVEEWHRELHRAESGEGGRAGPATDRPVAG